MPWDTAHRDQRRPFDMADGVLFRFAHVNHMQRGSATAEFRNFSRGYFHWYFIHNRRVYQLPAIEAAEGARETRDAPRRVSNACYTQFLNR